jgi:hypothetical protein
MNGIIIKPFKCSWWIIEYPSNLVMGKGILMFKNEKSNKALDLIVIFIITCITLTFIMAFGQKAVIGVVDGLPLLIRTIYIGFIQFAIAGLGVVIIMLWRRERFEDYGLKREGITKSLIFGSVLIIIFLLYTYIKEGSIDYFPFRQVNVTPELIKAGFPVNIIGMLVVAGAWGFFEGFNYIYISKKINELVKIKIPFLRMGPIIMGISCIFVHGAVGQNMLEILGTFFIVYFVLLIPELTENSWGSILIFMLFWNAV